MIAVTASAMTHDRQKILDAGFDGYQSKPISIDEFVGAVRRSLDARMGVGARERRVARQALVVDDTPLNVKLLGGPAARDRVCGGGDGVREARRSRRLRRRGAGPRAASIVMMPEMSGYEVCARIRANPETAMLPVVMVTALDPGEERE